MSKYKCFLLLIFLSPPIFAGNINSFAQWVPNGWKLIKNAVGDLNRDRIDDIVLVTEETNPANFKKNSESLGAENLNLNSRWLIIILSTSTGLKEVLRRDDLLPSQDTENDACLADSLEGGGVSINRGNLVVQLQDWRSCGGYGVTNEKFTFRLDGTRFRLIGYDYSEFSRSTGSQSEISTNFLTGKKKFTTGVNAFEESKPKVIWKNFNPKGTFFLDEINLYCDSYDPEYINNWCQ